MTVQIEQGRATLENIREEVRRGQKLYRPEIWKILIAAIAAAGVIGGVIGHFIK